MTARPGAQAPSAHPTAPECLRDHWRRPVIALRADLKIVLAAQPVDLRKSVHTLWALVSEAACEPALRRRVFVFRSKRMDRVKLLRRGFRRSL